MLTQKLIVSTVPSTVTAPNAKAPFELLPNYVRLERKRKMERNFFLRWELKNKAAAKKRERQRLDLAHFFTTTAKPKLSTIIIASTQFF